ncbi:MAG: NUDIX hydrolase [Elusimicrobiota bacterium]|jgi:8-oxo-dGTP pyrophosphatase MutT (NUDIX family)
MSARGRYGWKTVRSSIRYRNPWITVREDAVVYPNGQPGIYGVVEKGPGVCVVPVTPEGGVYLIRQYRYTVDRVLWELPAGAIGPGETEARACRRELLEETGLSAGRLERLGMFHTALGHETAAIIAYRATGLSFRASGAGKQHDESILEIRKFSPPELRRMVRLGRVPCGIALASLQLNSLRPGTRLAKKD